MILKYSVTEPDKGEKVLTILKQRMRCSGTLVKRLKSNNTIYLNGQPTYSNVPVMTGDIVSIAILEHRNNHNVPAQNIPIEVLFEDEFMIIINKTAGIAVHPAGNYIHSTLANALRYYFWEQGIDMTIRPVGRLDRNTSGIVIFAKNSHVMSRMIESLNQSDAAKIYIGLVHGTPAEDSGLIDLPIKRAEDSIISRVTAVDGKPSQTLYKVIEKYKDASLIEYKLLTGRTHQIRLHSSSIGCPLVGDGIYGDDSKTAHIIARHALHCSNVSFTHPFTEKHTIINAPLPSDIQEAISHFNVLAEG